MDGSATKGKPAESEMQDPVKAKMVSVAYTLTQPLPAGDHDTSLTGMTPWKPSGSPPPPPESGFEAFMKTVAALPKHFIIQLMRTIQPMLAVLLSLALGAGAMAAIHEASTINRASGLELLYAMPYASSSPLLVAAAHAAHAVSTLSWGIMLVVPFVFMWNWRKPLRPLLKDMAFNSFCVVEWTLSIFIARLSLSKDFAPEPLWTFIVGLIKFFMMVNAPMILYHIKCTCEALVILKNPVWAWMYTIYTLSLVNLGVAYFVMLRYLMGMSDVFKLVFVLLVNAPLMELLSVMSRFTARSVRHNHPTTSWMPICLGVIFKKLFMRFVVGSMKSSAIVTAVSVMSGLVEIVARVTMPKRDKFVYQKLFGPYLPEDLSPTSLMTNARSKTLRAETESLEGVTDMVFIVMGMVWPHWYLTSLNGTSLPNIGDALGKAAIQWCLESALDVIVCLFLAVVQNYHILAHGRSKCRFWSTVVALLVFFLTNFLSVAGLGVIVCTQPGIPAGTNWVFCSTLYD